MSIELLQGQYPAGSGGSRRRGVGLALLPCFIGHALPMLSQLTPPLPEMQGELWLLTHPDLRNTARVRTFLEFCASEFAQRRAILKGKRRPEAGSQIMAGAHCACAHAASGTSSRLLGAGVDEWTI